MKTKALLKQIKGRTILDAQPCSFEPGRIYAVMGSNGSGKSTFARSIALEQGLEEASSIGYMPQKNFAFRLSVLKNVMLTAGSEDEAREILCRLNMGELMSSNAKNLSGGETAKLALARVLLKKTDLLILDEPTAAMDTESAVISERLIRDYAKANNAAILLITHSQAQARRLADEILIMSKGKIIESGPCAQVLDSPRTEEARQFLAM